MHLSKRVIVIAALALSSFGVVRPATALPGPLACALVDLTNLESLRDGTLVQPSATEEQRRDFLDLRAKAKARITATFGEPQAHPIVAFIHHPDNFWPVTAKSTGGTHFIGPRACVILGPQGNNVDVVAHELMHAELSERVGYLRRFTEVPTWFDEGVAMQVDFRPRYSLGEQGLTDTQFVRQLTSFRLFFSGNEIEIVKNYAAAKVEVGNWLAGVGAATIYSRLDRIRNGESFDAVISK